MARKVNAKDLAKDVQDGMHPSELRRKYELSPGQLERLMARLDALGLLAGPEPENATRSTVDPFAPDERLFKCPSCGMPQAEAFEVCPQCGVIVSKFEQTNTAEPRAQSPLEMAAHQAEPVASTSLVSKIAIGAGAGLVALIAIIGLIAGYGRQSQPPAKPAAARRAPAVAQPSPGQTGPFRDMIDNRMPDMGTVDPKAQREMEKILRDVGNLMDERVREEAEETEP